MKEEKYTEVKTEEQEGKEGKDYVAIVATNFGDELQGFECLSFISSMLHLFRSDTLFCLSHVSI